MLYGRTIIIMFVSLYTSKVILNVLGVNDFGIYEVIGGIVTMFALVGGSITSATQRFLNFEMGKGNQEKLKQIFSVALIIHFMLAATVLLLGETAGLWFLNSKMNISAERMYAANWVYQCSLITFIINLISLPYNATVIAHEKMNVFAIISIIEVVLKLGIVFLLQLFLFDKLIVYAILMLLVAISVRLIYGKYCSRHFKECSFVFCKNKSLYREMTGFAGWTMIGSSSGLLMMQGVNILLNIFFGVAVNAARGIAFQVQRAVVSLINNFTTAMNPQITKLYASGENKSMMSLVVQGSKFSFYLLLILALPVLIETKTILLLWLNKVPEYTVDFVRLALIYSLLHTFSQTLVTSVAATGKVKYYQMVTGGLQSLNFPVSWLLLYLGFQPQITFIASIVFELCCLVSRIWFCHKLVALPVGNYLGQITNCLFVALISSIIPFALCNLINTGISRLIMVVITSLICCSLSILYAGCSKIERKWIVTKVRTAKNRYFTK